MPRHAGTRIGRAIRAAALLGASLLALGVPSAGLVAADTDTTPPTGTLLIEGGAAWTTSTTLHLDVPATDNVGVTTVRVTCCDRPWTDYPYAPKITYTLEGPAAQTPDRHDVAVQWLDAAGNAFQRYANIGVDWVPPDLTRLNPSFALLTGPVRLQLIAYNEPHGTPFAKFSSDGGATWGSEIPQVGGYFTWDPFDAAQGGSLVLGPRKVAARVRDQAGNWSNVQIADSFVTDHLALDVPPSAVTGSPVTISPRWAHQVVLPDTASCMWTFMWGDDESINNTNRNDTFGMFAVQGTSANGYCRPWTFVLPWTPVRRYLVSLRVTYPGKEYALGDVSMGSRPGTTAFTSAVGSTSRHVTSSNLPMFYILPGSATLTVGQPAVYHGYAIGGATIRRTDKWVIEYENVPEFHPGSSELTFYPKVAGHLTVCLYREFSAGAQITACFDPTVRRASVTPVPTAPPVTVDPATAPPTTSEPSVTPAASEGGEPTAVPTAVPASPAAESAATSQSPTVTTANAAAAPAADIGAPAGLALIVATIVVGITMARPALRAGLWRRLRRQGPAG